MSRGRAPDADDAESAGSQRLDKWLWYARVAKTRTLAAGLVTAGRIRVNKVRCDKPSQSVKPGDVVTATARPHVRVLKIVRIGTRRGPPAEAETLFEELTPARLTPKAPGESSASAGAEAGNVRTAERLAGSGRPTKRERRETDRLKGRVG